MYIGIDLGTSGVKAILLNEQGDVIASQRRNSRSRVRIRYGQSRTLNNGGWQRIAP